MMQKQAVRNEEWFRISENHYGRFMGDLEFLVMRFNYDGKEWFEFMLIKDGLQRGRDNEFPRARYLIQEDRIEYFDAEDKKDFSLIAKYGRDNTKNLPEDYIEIFNKALEKMVGEEDR